MSVNVTQQASFAISGITATGGSGLNLVANPALLTSNAPYGDYEAETYTVNPLTDFTDIPMEEIVTGRIIWVQTDNPIQLRLSQVAGLTRAFLVLADITYTAKVLGIAGNAITIQYMTGGIAGSEIVTVVGSVVTVQIANNISTATQVAAALSASAAASSLITLLITGTPGNSQSIQVAPVPLAGGTSGVVSSTAVVRTFYHSNMDFTAIAVANESIVSAHINVVFVGDRATNPGTPGVY